MAKDESDERDSAIARLRRIFTPEEYEQLMKAGPKPLSATQQSPLDQIYEAALKQEREILAQTRKHALWQPPSEEEFNRDWITPLDALDVSDIRMADDSDKWEIVEKLRAGQIIAVARTGQLRGDIEGVQPFVHVYSGAWSRMDQGAEYRFWQKASLVVEHRDHGKQRFFDIRFDPETFSGKPPRIAPLEEPVLTPQQGLPLAAPARAANLRGAKRKDWWDLLWIEMIRRIRAGTLNPKDKAELQRILEDCVDEIGGNYGDSTLKPTASNLFEYLEEIRGK